MVIHMKRPAGAWADVSELEYISALMQTDQEGLRVDGSLTATDIHFFLKSRYGLRVPKEQIQDWIIGELAAGGGSERASTSSSVQQLQEEHPDLEKSEHYYDANDGEVSERASKMISGSLVELENGTFEIEASSPVDDDDDNNNEDNNDNNTEEASPLDPQEKGYEKLENATGDMDLAQVASLLLFPHLRAMRQMQDKKISKKLLPASSQDSSAPHELAKASDDPGGENVSDGHVLAIILAETGLQHDQEITRDVLELIIACFGEEWPPAVLDAMLATASNATGGAGTPRLNQPTLLKILTDDIGALSVPELNNNKHVWESSMFAEAANSKGGLHELNRIYTASNIDCNADTYKSATWQVLAWYAIVVTLFAYLFNGPVPGRYFSGPNCSSEILCPIAVSTAHWLEVFLKLSIIGFPFFFLGTLGNSVYLDQRNDKWLGTGLLGLAIVSTLLFTFFPFFHKADFALFHTYDDEDTPEGEELNNRGFMGPVSLVLGAVLLLIQLHQITRLQIPQAKCCTATSAARSAREIKLAAAYKVNRMVQNAMRCHNVATSPSPADGIAPKHESTREVGSLTDAIVRFQQGAYTQKEPAGGVLWTWRHILDRKLFTQEGVWVSPRLVQANIAQWSVVVLVLAVFGFGMITASGLTDEDLEEVVEGLTIKQLQIIMIIGFLPAFSAATLIAVTYIPSAVASVLRYRAGVWGSLRDGRFLQNRVAMDSANLLFGAAFWTCLCSSAAIFGVISFTMFLFLWEGTRQSMGTIAANLIAMFITMCTKQLIMLVIRNRWSRGFYRSRPAAVNVSNAIQEVWNLGLTTFTTFVRATKLLAICLIYIGRIDMPVVSPGVGWVFNKIPLDGLPHCFYRDLLLHDAHRHPLIERLGLLYMLKLRHGQNFGNLGGGSWRLLFTLSLMPWLRKYRFQEVPVDERRDRGILDTFSKDQLLNIFVALGKNYSGLMDEVKAMAPDLGNLADKERDNDDSREAMFKESMLRETMLRRNTALNGRASTRAAMFRESMVRETMLRRNPYPNAGQEFNCPGGTYLG